MRLTKSLIKADIIAAKQAIDYYDQHQIKDMKNIAAYHLQQAAEKILKYQIYQAASTVDHHRMYTHDISRLIDYARNQKLDLIIPEYIWDHANSITDWEAGSRYDIGFTIRIDVLKKCYEAIAEWEKMI